MAEVSKTGDAMGRGSWRSSFLGAPGAEFLRETSARKNFLGTGATSPPSPRFPGTWGEGRKIQATASVPKKTVSLEGCTSVDCAQFCATPESEAGFAMASRAVLFASIRICE